MIDGIAVSRETRLQLSLYADLVRRWNPTISLISANLLSRLDDEIRASCELVRHIPSAAKTAVDIGSGNGLPAVPISIARPLRFDLVEADLRKATFLREVARVTGAPIAVRRYRVEQLPSGHYDVITSRAFAPLHNLLAIAHRMQHAQTLCVFPKGNTVSKELEVARRDFDFDVEQYDLEQGSTLLIRGIRPL